LEDRTLDTADPVMNVDEFLAQRFELPESGQWSELHEGRLVHLQPPDLDHGTTVLNLANVLAGHATTAEGYPCFDLGLLLDRQPDTVWFPSVSYFEGGPRFAETDKLVSETVPAAVIELASTADRRRPMADRARRYLRWGVREVWIIDPAEESVQLYSGEQAGPARCWSRGDTVVAGGCLAGLEFRVDDLFVEPKWWS
jgi:Uma2 family endonuclease